MVLPAYLNINYVVYIVNNIFRFNKLRKEEIIMRDYYMLIV